MNQALLLSLSAFLLCTAPRAQQQDEAKFIDELAKAVQYKDDKSIDRLLKSYDKALNYFEALVVARWSGDKKVEPLIEGIMASWARVFENNRVLEKIDRWVESQTSATYANYTKLSNTLVGAYTEVEEALKSGERPKIDLVHENLTRLAAAFEQMGHHVRAAETWVLDSILLSRVRNKTLADRQNCLFALERFIEGRKSWEWTQDHFYVRNLEFTKAEKEVVAKGEKDKEKRKSEGYDADAKDVDALVMPGVAAERIALEFAAMKEKDLEEADYGPRGGPVPALWWEAQFGKDKSTGKPITEVKLPWFLRVPTLLLKKTGGARFVVTARPDLQALGAEVDAGGKPKVVSFFLDEQKAIPYAMCFWTGSDKERFFEADLNLQWSDAVAPVFYRSAASWHGTVGGEVVTFYDDSADGKPCETETWKREMKLHTLGEPQGTAVPELDSMRIGKGPRVPYSEFAFVGGRWIHMKATITGASMATSVRPLNPAWFKLGKVKVNWQGPKPSAPDQLVVQGRGTLATAYFDIAGGKEVDLPAGEYELCIGRIVEGKGPRVQTALITRGKSQPFKVEEGKTLELKMGAPFRIEFERGGSGGEAIIDATKIALYEQSGALLGNLFNMVLVPEVLSAKAADGKGAKTVGKFVKMTDPEMVNKAAVKYATLGRNIAALPLPEDSRDGTMELKVKVPADHKVGLQVKQHPLFGKLDSEFK